jgi:two-component system chemotaxis response regulator CheB
MAVEALAAGAVAVVAKPRLGLKQFLEESQRELLQTLKAAARARPKRAPAQVVRIAAPGAVRRPPANAPAAGLHTLAVNKPIVIGSSTGGTQAIESVLTALAGDSPGIAIVQHMPEKFTAMYAQRLDGLCEINVREARDGDRLERGVALIAPGSRHMKLRKAAGQYFVSIVDGPPVNRHKPSVDVLFRSVAECAGRDALAIMLTGMGDDGARGMKQMHDCGARTIAQNEETCVVFGMPKEAIRLGAVDTVLPIDGVAAAIRAFDARG